MIASKIITRLQIIRPTALKHIDRQHAGFCCLTLAITLLLVMAGGEASASMIPLQLSPAPPMNAVECDEHGAPLPAKIAKKGPGKRPATESEHRPQPMRTYYFNDHSRLAKMTAYVRRPDGSVIEPTLQLGVNPNLSFPTLLGDGPVHGANNVYLLEQVVENRVLKVRTAQWLTMHHSCGWGHDHKFDEKRTSTQSLDTVPLEIVVDDLWDTNFHAKVTSGQLLNITVLNYGKPLSGAKIQVQTEQKWVKEVVTGKEGSASLQLIKDYYPTGWSNFKRTRRGSLLVTATYEAEQRGIFKNHEYDRVQYITTLPWHYSPAPADYSSYALGLLIGFIGLSFTGGGVYFYRERRKKPYQGISLDD